MDRIYKNPLNDFNIVFELFEPTNQEFLSGVAGDLDSNTIEIYYFQGAATNDWVSYSYTGTVSEIGSSGSYCMTILAASFTNREEDYPVKVTIIDDDVTKRWRDKSVDIEPSILLERVDIKRGDNGLAYGAFRVQKEGFGFGIEVVAQHAMRLEGTSSALSLLGNMTILGSLAINGIGYGAIRIRDYNVAEPGTTYFPLIRLEETGNQNIINVNTTGSGNGLNFETLAGKDINAKELDLIVDKLPAGLISDLSLSTVVDGDTIELLFAILKSSVIGKYVKDSPSINQLTFFAKDNVTPLAILNLSNIQRTRIQPT